MYIIFNNLITFSFFFIHIRRQNDILFSSGGYINKIDFCFFLPEKMSQTINFDWTIFALIGGFLLATILIMIKLTIGSCYKPVNVKIKN